MKRAAAVLLASLSLAMMAAPSAHAATAIGNTINQVLSDYHNSAQSWESTISSYATRLFWLLATIELLWVGIKLVLRGADFGEFVTDVTQFILFVGFFYALLLNGSGWANDIVSSFVQAGNAAASSVGGASGLTPAAVLDDGVGIVAKLWNSVTIASPGYDVELVMIGIAVLLTLGVITAYMCEALIESYLVITAGILFFGFGGSRWTKDFAIKILTYAVSVGAKLFFLELIVALGMQFINRYVANTPNDAPGFAELVGVLVTMLALVILIPSMVQSLVNGSSFSTGSALLGAVGTASAAAAGGVLAGGAALGLGGTETMAAIKGMSPGASRSLRIAASPIETSLRAGWHSGSAAVNDLGRRLSGRPGSNHGTAPGRMAGDMGGRIGQARAPSPPSGTPAAPSAISGDIS